MRQLFRLALLLSCAAFIAASCKPSAAPSETQTASPAQQAAQTPPAAASPAPSSALMNPATLTAKAPDDFKVSFETTKGDFVIEAHRAWAPNGVDRFYNAVKAGYYDGDAFFRVVKGFMVQFGINPDPAVNAKWVDARIPDDPASGHSNTRGMVTYAMAGPNTRTTQLFVNYGDNASLDSQGFTPIGQVVSGMDVVDALYGEYGDAAAFGGHGPDQGRVQSEGAAYLRKDFPNLDWIKSAKIQ